MVRLARNELTRTGFDLPGEEHGPVQRRIRLHLSEYLAGAVVENEVVTVELDREVATKGYRLSNVGFGIPVNLSDGRCRWRIDSGELDDSDFGRSGRRHRYRHTRRLHHL